VNILYFFLSLKVSEGMKDQMRSWGIRGKTRGGGISEGMRDQMKTRGIRGNEGTEEEEGYQRGMRGHVRRVFRGNEGKDEEGYQRE
jgi:hypothetical protein